MAQEMDSAALELEGLIRAAGGTRRQAPQDSVAQGAPAQEVPGQPEIADVGKPFYKPAHFRQWKIGDELLRRNATDDKKYIEGKVRRVKKEPASGKGKRAVYWYSFPDVRKRWPEKFARR